MPSFVAGLRDRSKDSLNPRGLFLCIKLTSRRGISNQELWNGNLDSGGSVKLLKFREEPNTETKQVGFRLTRFNKLTVENSFQKSTLEGKNEKAPKSQQRAKLGSAEISELCS